VPVLITNRFKIWQKRGIPLLRLPCQEPKKIRAKKAVVSHFWKGYCDNLNKEYDFWQERLTSLQMPQYNGEMFLNTYAWLVAAYSVLYPYLSTVMGDANLNLLSVTEFASYVDEWLCNIEKQNDLDASEEFIYKLHCLKEEGIIEFVKPQQYEKKTDGKIVMAVDEKFVYISRNDFTDVVQRILPGCTEREVYEKLVEADYAKVGDSGHCFPKCSQNAGFSDGRKRMVHIRRELLLTEEELLLEV
jgi:hypothetical protein